MSVADRSAVTESDRGAVQRQLGREARGMVAVAHRCACGEPDVVTTAPRLPDGTPFPTTYYLTCPRLTGAVSTLEAEGRMRQMQQRLGGDAGLQATYQNAHENYLSDRNGLGDVPEITGISAGGMPDRVKCLHVLVGHALASGPDVNPFGDEALHEIIDRGLARGRSCAERSADL
ncbi:MAG: DUF501 domain-containing protein [Actinomycetia bacterium]|nr:DUF501 domain-containing protein [Actinomycetes bacterium]